MEVGKSVSLSESKSELSVGLVVLLMFVLSREYCDLIKIKPSIANLNSILEMGHSPFSALEERYYLFFYYLSSCYEETHN